MAIIIQEDATELSSFKSVNCSTCFGWYFTHHQELITLYLQCLTLMRPLLLPVASVTGWELIQPRSRQITVTVSLMPDTVDTVLWAPDDAWSRLRLKCDGTRTETRFRLWAKRTSPFKSAGASVQSTTGSRGVRISGSNAGYTTFRGSVKSTGYPLHSPVSPSLPHPCVTVCHHISTGLYHPKHVKQLTDLNKLYSVASCWITIAIL